MKINKYCKFLIYLWTNLIFGSAALLCILFLLAPIIGSLTGGITNTHGPVITLMELAAGGISFFIIAIAAGIWLGPTLLLLLFGLISAPKEEEDQSGIGKAALIMAITVLIAIFGLLLFDLSLNNNDKTTGFAILGTTFGLAMLIIYLTFGRGKPEEVGQETEKIKEIKSDDRIGFCSKCGKKISKDDVFCKYCGKKL